jgi:hypothetical protein
MQWAEISPAADLPVGWIEDVCPALEPLGVPLAERERLLCDVHGEGNPSPRDEVEAYHPYARFHAVRHRAHVASRHVGSVAPLLSFTLDSTAA